MNQNQQKSQGIEQKSSNKLRDANYEQRKKEQLQILDLLEQKLRSKFQQKILKSGKQQQNIDSFFNNQDKINKGKNNPKIVPIKKVNEFESSSSEYQYIEAIEPIFRKETLSKKDCLKKKKIIKGIDEATKNKLRQKLQENQQPLSPPSSIEIFESSNTQNTVKMQPKQIINTITDEQVSKPQANKMKPKKEQPPFDSEYSEYELSPQPQQLKTNLRKQDRKSIKEKGKPEKIILQDQKDQTIQKNLNQIQKFQQKQKSQIIKTLKNPPKMAKSQSTNSSMALRGYQDEQRHNKVSALAKIFIQEEYSFNNIRKKKKNGSLPIILKSMQVGEFGNLSTYLIKTTIREIEKQLIQKCKLHLKKLSTQEFNFIRTPLLKAKQIMPKDHLSTFLSIVGYAFQLNLTLPSEKDVIALYQFMLIKLQEQMKNKEIQKIQHLEKEVNNKVLKTDQKEQNTKSKEITKIAKKSNSVYSDPFKRPEKQKEEKKEDNFQDEDFLKKLQDFVKDGKKDRQ